MWRNDLPRNTNPFRFMLFSSRPHAVAMSIALLAVVCASTLNIVSTYVFKNVVDAVAALKGAGGSLTTVQEAVIVYVLISLLSTLLWRISGFIGMHWSTGVRATGRYALTAYVTKHSQQYFSNRFAGSILSKIANASGSVKDMVEQILWQFTGFIISMIAAVVVLYFTNQTLAAIFLGWVCIITPLNIYLARRRTPLSSATQKAETALGGATVDVLSNMTTVHEYANRQYELGRLKDLIIGRRVTGLRNWRYGESVLLGNGLLQILFIGALLLVSVELVRDGLLSAGDIALILMIVVYVEDRLTFIGQQMNNFADAWGQVSESLEDILEPHDVPDQDEVTRLPALLESVEFKDVSFDYENLRVFDQFSLHIPKGQKVGLVGRSGAGKSTLVKLLLRHYDLSEGEITIGGTNIAHVSKEHLREHVAVVPQEPLLFHRTIRENISYGNHSATEEQVLNAATLAEAHDFIMRLSEGYDSMVGERGVKLSGGQRQRIAIARAILKDAPILLLDEATSALDSESEVAVQKALFNLMQGRTVIAIAHRLSTLRAMDRIIVMDQGQITEDGTHEELLEKKGLYASLWSHQASGFLEE